jgi:M6 family metalloprotease-like protein
MKRQINLCILTVVMAIVGLVPDVAFAVLASPQPFIAEQPDGTKIVLRVKGDEWHHWLEDHKGYLVIKEPVRKGRYMYAKVVDQERVSTGLEVGKVNPAVAGLRKGIIPPRRKTPAGGPKGTAGPAGMIGRPGTTPPNLPGGTAVQRVPALGTVNNLVILCQFSDHGAGEIRAPADFEILFNAIGGDPVLAPTGSVLDYYFETSYGVFTFNSTIVGWVTLPQNEAYYANGQNGFGPYPNNAQRMVEDALNLIEPLFANGTIDAASLDQDGDGYIDAIDIIHSGYGAEFSGDPDRIWSHKSNLPTVWTSASTGLMVSDYHTEPALFGTSGNQITTIGVICHETGHFFGLPDLYDTDGSSEGAGSWCLMANSWGFGGDGSHPPHPSAWSKIFLGWVTPTVITNTGVYTAPEVETDAAVFRIGLNYPVGEYLLIENRQPTGIENVIPQGGLAVWHIDDTKGDFALNNVNNDEGYPGQSGWPENLRHYRVALLQADGNYDLERANNRGDAGDLYHAAGVSEITSETVPNTDSYQGPVVYAVDNDIIQISASGQVMTFMVAIEDIIPPTPDPAEWEIEPQATGLHTIAMEAKVATDRSGVEYFFKCVDVNPAVPDPNVFNSGWQDGALYERGDFNADTTYTFRVKYRDKSENQNETGWSAEKFATTASGSDTLPPFPSPSRWEIKPKVVRLQPPYRVRMSAKVSTDENGPVKYFFRCTYINPPGPPPSNFNSGWISSNIYTISSGLTLNSTYTFTVKARDVLLNETAESIQASVRVGGQGANILTVPVPYATIQDAINASSNGDIVEVRPGTYRGTGNRDIDFLGRAITVRSVDPNDPSVVAGTIIDVEGITTFTSHRAFDFRSGESSNSILAGFTITNGFIFSIQPPGIPPGGNGLPGANEMGGAIRCTGSSPTIRNCVIDLNFVFGGFGGDGAPGDPGVPGDPNQPPIPGGNGGNGGSAFGGGIYCNPTSSPTIYNCTISSCVALGGYGGDGGIPGGNGGNGGDGWGGGIYCDAGSQAIISNCTISNCLAYLGEGGAPGGIDGHGFGGGVHYGSGYAASTIYTEISGNEADNDGGGIYCDTLSNITLINCDISNNDCINGNGGGIWHDHSGTLALNNCNISNNYCINGSGGGIWYDHSGTLTLNNCIVSNNTVPDDEDGGGIYAGSLAAPLGTTVIIDSNSTISGNIAGYGGGGLFLIETNLTVDDSTISNNDAIEGAGVWAYNCIANVSDCMVRSNSATELGGGFAFINGLATINNSVMTGNSANGLVGSTGGALFFEGWSDIPHQVTNCLISDNAAYSDGGGLSNNIGAWVQITNCTFADNEVTGSNGVGGGISCAEYWAYVEIFNSILWGNEARGGGSQIAVGDPDGSQPYGNGPYADVDVSYSDVQGGEEGVWLEDETQTYTALWWLEGNIDEDPLFAKTKATEQTYFLSQVVSGQLEDSPCVDAGDGIAIPGTTRTDYVADSGTVDMGYHYQAGLGVPQYQLTIEVINQGYGAFGTVLPPWEPGTYNVNQGRVVELHAEPNAGWEVYEWTGTDYVPVYPAEANYNTVTMNSNKTVTVEFAPHNMYKLVTYVIGNGTIEPAGLTIHSPGTVVPLTATPANPAEVIIWTGTDDDFSDSRHNTVTMNAHKEVTVEFYAPRTLYVPGDYTNIQLAVNDANDRDIILIAPGNYIIYEPAIVQGTRLLINGKAITITSVNPDDPCTVAATVIEGGFLILNTDRDTVINGLTITGNYGGGSPPDPTVTGVDGAPGGPAVGGGMMLHNYASEPRGYTTGSSSPTVRNCIFLNCSVFGGNGANGANGSNVIPGGDGGWAGWAQGGAVSIGSGSHPIFINCSFIGCFVQGGDGGNGGNAGPPRGGHGGNWGDPLAPWWDYGPFDDYLRYSGYGGAVYCGLDSSPEFVDCNFVDNYAYGGSCGVSGAPTPGGWPTQHYRIDRLGGAIYCADGSSPRLTGCTFINNEADVNGPATHHEGGPAPVNDDPYISYGGAIAFENGATPIFDKCTFNGNLATIGGGMWVTWADLNINDCNFIQNTAFHGGGVLFVGGTANITGSNFSENEATVTAGQGGGICCLGANARIVDCNISNNDANGSGGGIYISNKDISGEEVSGEDTVLVKNCLITGNSASRDGGGISANWHSEPNIVNCTIANNVVTRTGFGAGYGGGVCCSYGNYTNIINSILWGNSGQRGPQLAIGTGYEYYPLPSTVDISYSDVKGGQSYVFIDKDCTLNWGAGNIHINPLFVTGPLGSYYLSQIAAGQPGNSACVDTGSSSAENLGLDRYTTRTDERPDRETVDMGYHYPFTPKAQPCRFCELVRDGIINFEDFAVFALNWLSEDCNPANEWCQHADVTFDTYVNFDDLFSLCECWLAEDTDAPLPNPSEWEIAPYSTTITPPYTVSMTAEAAFDSWGGVVEYYFECVTGNDSNSGWDPNRTYISTNLDPDTVYGYRVKARDARGNETLWSAVGYAVTGEEPPPPLDTDPPQPDPSEWETEPHPLSSSKIHMVATTAYDPSGGVQYQFECVGGGGHSTDWQDSPEYTDTGLDALTEYTYRVRTHDLYSNIGGYSDPRSATTLP